MSNNNIWYGFLEAGEKSTPVVRDLSLETENAKTVFLYNFARGIFLEYSLEIVEPKLRALKPEDISAEELENAFKAARKQFNTGRLASKLKSAAVPTAAASSTAVEANDEEDDVEMDMEDWDDFPDEDD